MTDSTVSMRVVRGLLDAVAATGRDPGSLLRHASFDPARLQALDARLPRSEMNRLCEAALDVTEDPAFGLHWAERLGETTFAPVSHLLAHAADLRQGFASLQQFHRLLVDEFNLELIEAGELVTITLAHRHGDSVRMVHFYGEMFVAGLYNWVRLFRPGAQVSFHFAYPAPPHHAEYARVLGAPRFDSTFTGLVFARSLLDAPAPNRDDDVHEALSAMAERKLSRITASTPYAARVRDYLVQGGWKEHASMEGAARAVSLSVRSLRRRLSEEQTSYFQVVNEALGIVAKQLLGDERRTIQEVAYEMGFSDASSFHRAFKRWTGITPNAFRSEK